jgi:hypothetical protein
MYAPAFSTISASLDVQALIGSGSDIRLYPNEAPQGTPVPYAVITQIGGPTENQLSGPGMADLYLIQIDCYSDSLSEARLVAGAIRASLEEVADIESVGRESRDSKTRHFGYQFDIEWLIPR